MKRLLVVAAVTVGVLLAAPSGAGAHPLGNFTVNRYSGLQVLPGQIRIHYVLDLAEIPTFQELPRIDRDRDGATSADELSAWAEAHAERLVRGLVLEVDGERLALAPEGASARTLPGQAGLDILRFEAVFAASAPERGAIVYEDRNDEGLAGWREMTAVGLDGRALSGSSVPSLSISDELRSYPDDALSSPPDVRSMTGAYAPGTSSAAEDATDGTSSARPATEDNPLARALDARTLPLVGLAIIVAVGFGAWHALLPGHGKTIMAAAMVGSGARTRHAVSVAGAVALMHSASVLVLGFAVLALEQTFRPEAVYPWLGVAAGVAALGVGAHLVRIRWGAWRHHRAHRAERAIVAEAGGVRHDHGTEVLDGAPHEHGHPHVHDLHLDPSRGLGGRGVVALAFAGGILPAPSALLVMLAAIQAHRVLYGIGLVAAFSAGLAAALLAVGLGALQAREAVRRRMSETASLAVPLVSAVAILLVGVVLTVRAASGV